MFTTIHTYNDFIQTKESKIHLLLFYIEMESTIRSTVTEGNSNSITSDMVFRNPFDGIIETTILPNSTKMVLQSTENISGNMRLFVTIEITINLT